MLEEEYLSMLHNANFPRADFKPELFDSAIMQKGFNVIWEQGMLCSCHDPISGQPDINCTCCKGKGYMYINPKKTRVLVTGLKAPRVQDHIGLDDIGSCYITCLTEDNVGYRDKFTFPDFTIKYCETLLVDRGKKSQEESEYLISIDTGKTRYEIIDVVSLRVLDKEYIRTVDFDISPDKRHIIWMNDEIEDGIRYSLLYTVHPVYIVMNPIHELRGTYTVTNTKFMQAPPRFIPLPKQFQIKREDFIPNG